MSFSRPPKRVSSVSSHIVMRIGSGGVTSGHKRAKPTILAPSGLSKRKKDPAARRAQDLRTMSWRDRAEHDAMQAFMAGHGFDDSHDESDQDALNTAPPGEEGEDLSHGGHNYEPFSNIVHLLSRGIQDRSFVHQVGAQRYDPRTRRDRVQIREARWSVQLDTLADAFLQWQHAPRKPSLEAPEVEEGGTVWMVRTVDEFTQGLMYFAAPTSTKYANEILIRHGFLGSAPTDPQVCISLRTLANYRQTHRVCLRLSIQGQVRKLCAMHGVGLTFVILRAIIPILEQIPYRRYLTTQFSIAYDVYLDILHRVSAQVLKVLKRDGPNWRMLNACPACDYQLEAEPPLTFSKCVAIDGNNSLRRIDPTVIKPGVPLPDPRTHCTDYWLTPAQVDVFKDEVKAKKARPVPVPGAVPPASSAPTVPIEEDPSDVPSDAESDILVDADEPGDVTSGSNVITVCIERWRNAGPEQRKRMWHMFVESGIFLAVCRHGFALTMCDMIQSGELAKYALAVTDRLVDVYGSDLAIGYDIGCAFSATVRSSRLLGPKALVNAVRFLVPSFHGHAHNRGCQLHWHPLYVKDAGLEDFETCERCFSASNHLASQTRHATAFHRHQAIEEHFGFWDEDKYSNLGKFLLDNYRQALSLIADEGEKLAAFQKDRGLADQDFERFLQEEKLYLDSLKKPRASNELHVAYIEALEAMESADAAYTAAKQAFRRQDEIIATYEPREASKLLAQLSRQQTLASTKLDKRLDLVVDLEAKLDIADGARWDRHHPQRVEVAEWMNRRDYHHALDELERLMVMRLFELTKLNMSGTAYALRTKIREHLRKRSDAVRAAIARYNKHAAMVEPPRPALDWKEVLDYTFVGEFDLLRFSREDIRQKTWADVTVREASATYFKVQSAHEEIKRLNVEVRRLYTAIHNEASELPQAIAAQRECHPALGSEIERRWSLREAVNNVILARLHQIRALPGFTGNLTVGQRKGAPPHPGTPPGVGRALTPTVMQPEDDELDLNEDDEVRDLGDRAEEWEASIV